MLHALAALLSLQLLGEAVVRWLAWPVPGPVLGMALLVLALAARPAWLAALRPTAQGLLQHLSLLFVPAGVGVMLHLQRLGEEAWAIGIALVLSTWIGMACAAGVCVALMRGHARRPDTPPADGAP
ncbi:CidA/LrgA family protein [Aquabacterium sp. A08]|uniref:CidA/LrgA family protein n=1 Tax=Aquabacterium sp. A08 TaxID=2718532 RepID=UPI00141DD4BD|nr:CidA/LrgA family protein [Aquabacterium sp. A08]NIC40397.1 CidA/LrgA family protein [Aquabacterium sp. A08]